MTVTIEEPKVWIGSLAAYNNGSLLGDWFDAIDAPGDSREWLDALIERGVLNPLAPRSAEDEAHGIERVPRTEEQLQRLAQVHEEIWCFDHEGFHGFLKGECSPVEARRLAELIDAIQADGIPPEAVVGWVDYRGEPITEWDAPTQEAFQDVYRGEYESEEAFAQEWFEETVAGQYQLSPKGERFLTDDRQVTDPADTWPFNYIDWDRATDDLMQGFHSAAASGGRVFIYSY